MPDAKSLLPGRAFRSEHAQLRPEPHSIASHGPAPMDPLQTTRMRNGVLYAAEWPCCHDPLRLSLGSEDPFYIHNPRVRRARLRTPPPGWARPPRAPSACASPARGEACAQRTSPLPATPPAARALRRARARGCLAAQAHECVLPSTPHPRRPHLLSQPLRCVLCLRASLPLATPQRWQGVLHARVHPSFVISYLPVNSPRTASAQPPAHTHAHRSLASLALRPRRSTPAAPPPPATERRAPRPPLAPRPHTRVASPRPSARACPFLHAAPPQTLDLEHRRSPLLHVLYSTPTRPFSPPPLQHSTLPKPWT